MKYSISQIILNKLFAITVFALVVFPHFSLAQDDAKLDQILGKLGAAETTPALHQLGVL